MYMMMNRSGGGTVREIIAEIVSRCEQQEQEQVAPAQGAIQAPDSECCILAQWASNSYYSVVIANRQDLPAILRAMQCFPADRGLQECCCLALGNLCNESPGNLMTVANAAGVQQVIAAMQKHPQSVAVQSAACDALRNMSGLILEHADKGTLP